MTICTEYMYTYIYMCVLVCMCIYSSIIPEQRLIASWLQDVHRPVMEVSQPISDFMPPSYWFFLSPFLPSISFTFCVVVGPVAYVCTPYTLARWQGYPGS